MKWWIVALGTALVVPLWAQVEPPREVNPKFAAHFGSGQYHEIVAPALAQVEKGGTEAALGYYRIGYVFECGLQRLTPALAYYYAGLEHLERTGGSDPQARGLLAAGIERALQTRFARIEQPMAHEVSVLVEGNAEILAPGRELTVGQAPRGDTRYRLAKAPVPLSRRWVHIRIDRPGGEMGKLWVGDRGRGFMAGYAGTEFRVRVGEVIRFFAEGRVLAPPDTAAAITGYAAFARRYPQSPLSGRARRRIHELEGGGERVAWTRQEGALPAVADVDVDIPRTAAVNADGVAVVIGNRDYGEYQTDVPDVEFALRDAAVVRQYLTRTLGFLEGNILYHENATHAVFRRLFGTREVPEGRLAQLVRPGRSDVFVYYSGHGAPDVEARQGYFVPVDCAPGDVRLNGYSLALFYENLGRLEARSVTVAVDACFSGGSQQGMLIAAASPVGIRVTQPALELRNGAVFASSAADEISSWYPEAGHGLFTYFFLKGLRGDADLDGDGRITAGELRDFVGDRGAGVPYWARRLYQGRRQTPGFFGDAARVLLEVGGGVLRAE